MNCGKSLQMIFFFNLDFKILESTEEMKSILLENHKQLNFLEHRECTEANLLKKSCSDQNFQREGNKGVKNSISPKTKGRHSHRKKNNQRGKKPIGTFGVKPTSQKNISETCHHLLHKKPLIVKKVDRFGTRKKTNAEYRVGHHRKISIQHWD